MTTPQASAARSSLAWLIHPVSVVALFVMILNDHVLKAQFGTWWTGKLSDVAGLIFFPALVALGLAGAARLARRELSPDRLAAVAIAVTAAGFTWVKVSDAGAATASAVLSAVAGPSIVLRDPTDLLALAALALAWWTARHATPQLRTAARRAAATIVLPIAVLASVATGPSGKPQATQVVSVNGQPYVWIVGNHEPDDWYRLTDVPELRHLSATDPVGSELTQLAGRHRLACLPSAPETCFRATPQRWGVDISEDGGDTWAHDIAVTDLQWERIARDSRIGYGEPGPHLSTLDVTVANWQGDEVVIAANGEDGIAIRNPDGVWTRYPHAYDNVELVAAAVPTPRVIEPSAFISNLLVLGTLLSLAAVPVTGAARRWRQTKTMNLVGIPLAIVLAAGFVALFGQIWSLNTYGEDDRLGWWLLVGYGGMLLVWAAACSFGIVLALGWHAKDRPFQAVGLPATIGFGATLGLTTAVTVLDVAGANGAASWIWDQRLWFAALATLVASAVVVYGRWLPAFERPPRLKSVDPRGPVALAFGLPAGSAASELAELDRDDKPAS